MYFMNKVYVIELQQAKNEKKVNSSLVGLYESEFAAREKFSGMMETFRDYFKDGGADLDGRTFNQCLEKSLVHLKNGKDSSLKLVCYPYKPKTFDEVIRESAVN